MAQLFSTLFFPIFPFALHVGVAVMFTAVALYLSSAGTPEYKIAFQTSSNNNAAGRYESEASYVKSLSVALSIFVFRLPYVKMEQILALVLEQNK